ncbi:MAG: heparinase II/III family protein [Clostridia bacterium]|nr:heparinase II/III family protein [Clostridia bacterium]MBQ9785784.1 heparinase II/III family protein [Clostridia bacterium]
MPSVYTYENLKKILATERGQGLLAQAREAYEALFEGTPIERPTYADFMHIFDEGGDTAVCDKIDVKRKLRFFCLQILALDDDRYIGDLEEMIAEFCAQYAWFSSYHHRDDVNKTFDYAQIDLDTAFMSTALSLTYAVMENKLRYDIKLRIRREIERRVILPFENNPTYFGLGNTPKSNWIACQTMGTAYAYLFVFPERLPLVKKKLFDSVEAYLSGLAEDGYCSEGYGYWYHGFGQLAAFLEAYGDVTGEDLSFLINRPKVQNCLAFGRAAVLKDGFGLPFADHQNPQLKPRTNEFYHIAYRRVFGEKFAPYDVYDGTCLFVKDENGVPRANGLIRTDCAYRRIFALSLFEGERAGGVVENGTTIFPQGGAFIANRDRYSIVAKAGHNDENHNHNDVGTFAFFADGKRIFPDVISHKYDASYFDDRFRYTAEVFAAGSMGHSVPILDGKNQVAGIDYKGVITQSSDDVFEVNLSGAYNTDVSTLKVRYELCEDRVKIQYTIDEPQAHALKFRFIAGYEPREIEGGFAVEGVKLVSREGLPAVAKRVEYLGHYAGVTVYTVDFDAGEVASGAFEFEIQL